MNSSKRNKSSKSCKKKCAEVFYESVENFSIICTQCNLEAIKFDDFLIHFKTIHCNDNVFIKAELGFEDKESFQKDACPNNNILYEEPIELTIGNADIFPGLDEAIKSENESVDEQTYDRLEYASNSEADEEDIPLKLLGDRTRRKRAKRTKFDPTKTEHTCDDCDKIYKTRKALTRHMREKHATSQSFTELYRCKNCTKTYITKSSLKAHERMKHNQSKDGSKPGTYPCSKCDKVYTDKYCLKNHLLRHLGQKNFSCDEPGCTRTFFTRKNLNFHVKNMHIAAKNYVCEMCGHSTKTAASLVMHKRTHTGEKPYNCPTCGKAFASQSGVREHEVTHTAINVRPHVCKICGKTFARPKALYHHMPLHSETKKFVCKICGKAYSQLAGLSAHKRQHSLNNFGEET